MQLDGENGLEHMVETYPHNMEGNVRQLFVDFFSSLGMKYCTSSVMTVSEITLQGRPWRPDPFISVGITESQGTTLLGPSLSELNAPPHVIALLPCL